MPFGKRGQKMKRYYLAYGSNLNLEQMRWRCPDARVLGTAWLMDYRLLFKGSKTGSYLTVEPHKGSKVPLAVFEVSPFDEERLDHYEGFPSFYYKKELKIKYRGLWTGRERSATAFIYIMHEERPFGIPSGSYVETCLAGYRDFEFDESYLRQALTDSTEGSDED